MVNSPSWAACSSSHNVSYPLPCESNTDLPFALRSRYPLPRGTAILPHAAPKSAKDRRTVTLTPAALKASNATSKDTAKLVPY
jgi:hypothetical protein